MKKIVLILFIIIYSLNAQDRHYWDQAVGGKTALLGGIAVAGVDDYSATFYNPGALSFLSKNSLNFNFNMYGIKDFRFENGGGPDIDSRYTRVSLYPASLAGGIPFLGDSLSRFSFMIYGNGYSYLRISERYEGYLDAIPSRPAPHIYESGTIFDEEEYLINEGKIDVTLSEVSVGFGYARKISDNVGLGFTILGAYRDQTKIRYESYSAYDTTYYRSAISNIYVDIDYWAIRFSAKFGIFIDLENIKLGATITTPSIPLKLASGGTDHASFTSNNVLVLEDSITGKIVPIDIVASDRQEGLAVNYQTPFSMALGFEYTFTEKTKAHFMCEWFAPLSNYVVMQPESNEFIQNNPIVLPSNDSADLLKVQDAKKSVFNFGIAIEQNLTEKVTGFAAFRTDFSNANFKDINGLTIGFTDFNIYHFTAGVSLNLETTFVGLGFEYSHAERDDFIQIFNFPTSPVDENDIAIYSQRGTSKLLYNNFNLFFGITQQI